MENDRLLSVLRDRIPDFFRKISPEALLRTYLRETPPPEEYRTPVAILSLGKAAGGLTAGFSSHFGVPPLQTLSILPQGYPAPPSPCPFFFGSHPVPDIQSTKTLLQVKRFLENLPEGGALLVALSGGSSSILAAPIPTLSLWDKATVTRRLLASGAPIEVVNALRIHLSSIKGGGLASLIAPRKCLFYVFSDIPGNDATLVGSAPMTLIERDGKAVLSSLQFWIPEGIPETVSSALNTPERLFHPEFPPGYAPCFGGTVASSETLLFLARNIFLTPDIAEEINIHTLTDRLKGEAREAGTVLASLILWQSRKISGWSAWIASGETTVCLPSSLSGQGGRSLELGLSLAIELRRRRAIVLSLASDGWDGNSKLAGTLIDSGSLMNPDVLNEGLAALATHDTAPFLRNHFMDIETGPSGSNLNDLLLVLLPPHEDIPR